jgi:ribosomal protein S6--L-glutamate ligase
VVVLGQEAAWVMEITPASGEFRANVHLGGKGRSIAAQGEILNLAQNARQAVGLDIAGVDLMQDSTGAWWLGEVNFTPGFRGLEQATGEDIAKEIMAFSLRKVRN